MSDYFDMSELAEVFFEEADSILQHLDEGILALEKKPNDQEIINDVFRSAHTLKGSSATMGFDDIADLTHNMETLLEEVRSGSRAITGEIIDALLLSEDTLRMLIQAAKEGGNAQVSTEEANSLIERVLSRNVTESEHDRPSAKNVTLDNGSMSIRLRISDECVMPSVRAFMVINALEGKVDNLSIQPDQSKFDDLQPGAILSLCMNPVVDIDDIVSALNSINEIQILSDNESETDHAPRMPEMPKADNKSQAYTLQTVRVGVDRLDTLMNLVGELSINRTRIVQVENELSARYRDDPLISGVGEASIQLGRTINELQEEIMKIRMVPVEQVFNRFHRMVRDLARKAGKQVEFIIQGGDTELDRSILEDIVDPVTHLLRNAVDHGVETPEERIANSKPATATVILAAKHEENCIIIDVEDDGRGIIAEDVKNAAIAKGAISKETAESLDDNASLQLMFMSGVSTAKEVTEISGRGVGMDVVKNNIERLSGSIEVRTSPGAGTLIRIRLPLTLAIVEALVTKVDSRAFAVPLTGVVETCRCSASDISIVAGRPALQFRDTVLPIVHLGDIFPARHSNNRPNCEEITIVVVRTGGLRIGISVDSIVGEQEVVIKSLGSYIGQVQGVSGATLLGDGRIALIVDVAGIPNIIERELAIMGQQRVDCGLV